MGINDKNIFDYINTIMSKETIMFIYNANQIKMERCELYCDFVKSLLIKIFDTYLGDDITTPEDQINHFNWCWNKNIENFKTEGLLFESKDLHDYFLEYSLEVFYLSPTKIKDIPINMKLWELIFDYGKQKTHAEVDTLVELYKIFDKAIKII